MDEKLYVAKLTISLFDRAENIVGKGERAGNQCFHTMLSPPSKTNHNMFSYNILLFGDSFKSSNSKTLLFGQGLKQTPMIAYHN